MVGHSLLLKWGGRAWVLFSQSSRSDSCLVHLLSSLAPPLMRARQEPVPEHVSSTMLLENQLPVYV